eukprot:1542182-Amphidinium_carterae.1
MTDGVCMLEPQKLHMAWLPTRNPSTSAAPDSEEQRNTTRGTTVTLVMHKGMETNKTGNASETCKIVKSSRG